MIRNETEYREASARLAEERQRLAEHRLRSRDAGLGRSRGRGRNMRLHRAERRSNQRAALAADLREPEMQPH